MTALGAALAVVAAALAAAVALGRRARRLQQVVDEAARLLATAEDDDDDDDDDVPAAVVGSARTAGAPEAGGMVAGGMAAGGMVVGGRVAGGTATAPAGADTGSTGARLVRLAAGAVDRLAALRGAVDHLEQSLHAIPQGVVLCDADGRPVFRNTVAQGYAGARHGEALVEAAVDEVLAEARRGVEADRTLDLFGPPRRTLVIQARPIGGDGPAGSPLGALAVIDDVSERRRLDAVRRDFVANISHELRTPVGALGLLAETLLAEDDPVVRDRMARRMLAETDRMARTIDDLLTLSRIESEEAPVREPVAAGLVLAEAVDRIRPAAEQREIEVVVHEPSARLAVVGDRRQLVSALYNLLDNAVKYSDPGSRVEARATTDGRQVHLTVSDQGIGIPRSDLPRIFERFYRVDPARSRRTGGTGLGLSIVRHVAGNHGGDVVVRSTEGVGSDFTLRVPVAPGPVAVGGPGPAGSHEDREAS